MVEPTRIPCRTFTQATTCQNPRCFLRWRAYSFSATVASAGSPAGTSPPRTPPIRRRTSRGPDALRACTSDRRRRRSARHDRARRGCLGRISRLAAASRHLGRLHGPLDRASPSSRCSRSSSLVTDQLPSTPSRKVPQSSSARAWSAAPSPAQSSARSAARLIAGLIAGVVGAVIGTYGGAEVRARLAGAFGRDLPAALIEDAVAILLALWVVSAVA